MGRTRNLVSLFLVSLFGLSFELFLGRYLTLALFTDYSYWVISVALLGYSFGGVVLTLWRDWFHKRHELLLLIIPPLLMAAAAAAFLLLRANPFNPLQLQNSVLWRAQVGNILLFYAALFPVFLLTGTYIGLVFLVHSTEMPRVYAMDLLGAAAGAVIVVAALFFVHPFHIPAVTMPVLFLSACVNAVGRPRAARARARAPAAASASVPAPASAPLAAAAPPAVRPPGVPRALPAVVVGVSALVLAAGMWVVLSSKTLVAPDFKRLHAVLGIGSAKVVLSRVSPAGTWLGVDDYTEYADVSMTNNYAPGDKGSPPRTLGLYRDGERVSALALNLPSDDGYIQGALSSFPYVIRQHPRVLLLGTDGGMRMLEAARAGAAGGVALEQPGDTYDIIRGRMEIMQPGFEKAWGMSFRRGTIFSLGASAARSFDIIDLGNDFLTQDGNNSWSFTQEAISLSLDALTDRGVLSIPVDISEVDVYALKMARTVAEALRARGVTDPSRNIMVYRTAWTCRLLVSPVPFDASDVAKLVSWCADRSFDTSWFPGIVPADVPVWNDLPPVSFEQAQVQVSDTAQDALRDDLGTILGNGGQTASDRYFNLAPSTMNRPDFYSISRLARARSLVNRLEILPEKEIGYLLNLAIFAEAIVLAALVLFLPFARRRRAGEGGTAGRGVLPRVFLYFSALGLGFFFIELTLVKKLSFLLDSATLSFAVVLAGVLVFSGLGSWQAGRFGTRRRRGLLGALPVIVISVAAFFFGLDPLMRAIVGLPIAVRIAISLALLAPVSFALGRPFSLATSALGERSDTYIPWAWAINGAFSVVATPLANVISASLGWTVVLAAALALYASTALTFPESPRSLRGS